MDVAANYAFVHGAGQGGSVWEETSPPFSANRTAHTDVQWPSMAGIGAERGIQTEGLVMEDVARELIADVEAARLATSSSSATPSGTDHADHVAPPPRSLPPRRACHLFGAPAGPEHERNNGKRLARQQSK